MSTQNHKNQPTLDQLYRDAAARKARKDRITVIVVIGLSLLAFAVLDRMW